MAMNDNQAPESRETAEGQQTAFYGGPEGNLDFRVRLFTEGRRSLGVTLLDPLTGEKVTV